MDFQTALFRYLVIRLLVLILIRLGHPDDVSTDRAYQYLDEMVEIMKGYTTSPDVEPTESDVTDL